MGVISSIDGGSSSIATELFTRSVSSAGGSSDQLIGILNFNPKNYLLNTILNNNEDKTKIKDIKLQTSTYGKIIPMVFGSSIISGNIIWSSDIVTKSIYNAPKFGKSLSTQGSYTTTIRGSFALAICYAPISSINAIYADGDLMNQANYNIKIYSGDNKYQDPTMVSYLGAENVPLFNNIVYAVFTDFPLEQFNGRIPNFTFAVTSNSQSKNNVNKYVKAINIIPGSGEFVYDTQSQYKLNGQWIEGKFIETSRNILNSYISNNTNSIESLNDLITTFPNLEWASIVVSWFTDSMNPEICQIYPAVEFNDAETYPDPWSVGNFTRATARKIGKDSLGNIRYGGTPSDNSIIRFIQELRNRGIKVCIYPMLMVDTNEKPWRGRITPQNQDGINNFFNQYSNFITHYANLLKGQIDAIIVGSELVGLTSFTQNNTYPGVDKLVQITQSIKQIVGNSTFTVYAADWTEYHHDCHGNYNMDKLWGSQYLDIIGIDAYFPLSNDSQSIYNTDDIISGWSSGEGYDFYYQDSANRLNPQPLNPAWAWKNVEYFWSNYHYKSNGKRTEWIPKSKPIWFTEYGFPSVDCCTNQPNVFYSQTSTESSFPFLSNGIPDFKAQESAILGTEMKWQNSDAVQMKFLYAWDARPYPAFPALTEIWNDCNIWEYGHFINGKIGNQNLGDLVSQIMIECGISEDDFDVSLLNNATLNGYVIDSKANGLQHLQTLSTIFNFDMRFENGKIIFQNLDNTKIYSIAQDDLIMQEENIYIIEKSISLDKIPNKIEIMFNDINNAQAIGSVQILDESRSNNISYTIKLPMPMTQNNAQQIGWQILEKMIVQRTSYKITLPQSFFNINVLDKINITLDNGKIITMQVIQTTILSNYQIEITGLSTQEQYNFIQTANRAQTVDPVSQVSETNFQIIELGNFTNEINKSIKVNFAVSPVSSKWQGCSLYLSSDNENSYQFVTNISTYSITGTIISAIPITSAFYIDKTTTITIMISDAIDTSNLRSITENSFLQLNQIGLFGKEIIAFQNVKQINKNTFEISTLIRGQFNTERIQNHQIGESFILLDSSTIKSIELPSNYIGKTIFAKAVSFNQNIENVKSQSIKITGKGLKNPDTLTYDMFIRENGDILLEWYPRINFYTEIDIDIATPVYLNITVNNNIVNTLKIMTGNQYLYRAQQQSQDGTSNYNFNFYVENIATL